MRVLGNGTAVMPPVYKEAEMSSGDARRGLVLTPAQYFLPRTTWSSLLLIYESGVTKVPTPRSPWGLQVLSL